MIRVAAAVDYEAMADMGQRFIRETSYASMIGEDRSKMMSLFARLEDTGLLIVSETDGKLNGLLGAIVYEHPISGETVASEVFWWTEPEARGAGVRMFKVMERWAKHAGATKIQMVAPNVRVGEFYKRIGFYEVETTFQRDLK